MCKQCYRRVCGFADAGSTARSHAYQHIKSAGHSSFLSLERLHTFDFGKAEQSPGATYTPNAPGMSRQQFLRYCLRTEVERVKQQM